MSTLRGSAYDPLRDFRFIVSFPGEKKASGRYDKLGFSKVSGLNLGTSDIIEYREGSEIISPRKIPGLNKYENITFEKGRAIESSTISFLEAWRENVAWYKGGHGGRSADGNGNPIYRKTIKIEIIDRSGSASVSFLLFRAWPVSLKFSDLDGQNSGLFISTLEVAIEGMTPRDASANNSSGSAGSVSQALATFPEY